MKKKKVLYIHHGWGIGGAPISLLNLILNLDRKIYEPIVLFTHKSEAIDLFKNEGIETLIETKYNKYFQHNKNGKLKFYNIYSTIIIFRNWLMIGYRIAPKIYSEINPDIIHLNSYVLSSWAFGARSFNIPVVCHNREPISKGTLGIRYNFIRYILTKFVNTVISISKDNLNRLDISNCILIYNPVAQSFYQKYKKNEVMKKQILFVGGGHKGKGLNLLLNALKYINSDIKIVLVGYYPEDNLKNKIIHNKFFKFIKKHRKQILLKGVVSQKDMIKNMQNSSLLIFPAVKPHFARPIIESYATKTPVIATDLIGMNEIVEEGITGFLVEPNSKVIGNFINRIIDDKTKLLKMGENGYKFSKINFTALNSARLVQKKYSELLNI